LRGAERGVRALLPRALSGAGDGGRRRAAGGRARGDRAGRGARAPGTPPSPPPPPAPPPGATVPPRPPGVRLMLHHRPATRGRWAGEIVFERGAANSQGIVHGGFLASILDVAMGYASLTLLADDELQRTVEIKVSFLRPAPPDRVLAEGEVLRRGRRI